MKSQNQERVKRGRKTNLTAPLQRKIFKLLERGHTVGTVCGVCGISERSYFDYCAKDAAFLAGTQRARAQGRVRIVDSILNDRDWRGKAWYLERTAANEFGRVAERPLERPLPETERRINVAFICDTKGKSLQEVANFPVIASEQAMAPAEPEPEATAGDLSFDGNGG
jgi:hypothetical protein